MQARPGDRVALHPDTVIIGFIANEVISIVENAGLVGMPMPAVILKAIDVLTKRMEEKDHE